MSWTSWFVKVGSVNFTGICPKCHNNIDHLCPNGHRLARSGQQNANINLVILPNCIVCPVCPEPIENNHICIKN